MAYLILLAAIILEIAGTSLLPSTAGFTRLWPTMACLAAYCAACFALARVVNDLQVGVAYALWAGFGTVAIVIIGLLFFGEPLTSAKVIGISLVISGAVILNLGGTH